MAATADPRASAAALEILREGGNAIDAAIAAQWVLNVVEPHSSGIGGGGLFVFYDASTKLVHTFDGREAAPQAAFPEMFLDEAGKPYPFWPERITGGLSVGVPGVLKLLKTVHDRFGSGRFSFGQLFEPGIRYGEEGFALSERLASFIEGEQERLRLFPASAALFLRADGTARRPGEIIKQPVLADTFRRISREGIGVFYEGEIARDIVRAVREAPFHPGYLTLQDMASYRVIERAPIHGFYRGYEIFGMGPPTSGGIAVQETLNILEAFDLNQFSESEKISIFVQAQALAFRDRNRYLGDSDFVDIPLQQLLSKERAKELAREIRPRGPAALNAIQAQEGAHTSHISIADETGNWAAFTTTIEHMFGSALVVPGRGILLNNELTDFDAEPYRSGGSLAANAPEGGKRPRSSMSPTLVFKDGQPFLSVGSPGGSRIIGTVLNILFHMLEEGKDLEAAMRAPRMINRGDETEMELPYWQRAEWLEMFRSWGLKPVRAEAIGNAQAVWAQQDRLIGMSDPRGEGEARGY